MKRRPFLLLHKVEIKVMITAGPKVSQPGVLTAMSGVIWSFVSP